MARTNAVAREFLLWLDANDANHPNPQDWLRVEPVVDGQPVTEPEMVRAVQRCASYELIKGMKASGSRVPLRVHLLDGGRECIDDYDADPRAWRDARRGGGATTYDQRVWITQGDYAQAVAHAQDVAQDMTLEVDPDRLADVADAADEVAGIVSPAREAEVRDAAGELREAAKGSDQAPHAHRRRRPPRRARAVRERLHRSAVHHRRAVWRARRMSARDREERALGDLLRALDTTPVGAQVPNHPALPWRIDGIDVGPEDRHEAVLLGVDERMLHAVPMGDGTLFAQRILGLGRECVRRYDGDVGAWRAARDAVLGGTYNDQRTTINQGDYGQTVVHSHDVDQRSGGASA